MKISVIIPVLNEAEQIVNTLAQLKSIADAQHEIIVVDGCSKDDTLTRVGTSADRVLVSPAGRAQQMNVGAEVASGDVLLFLHADTQLPVTAFEDITHAVETGRQWGRFDVRLSGGQWPLRIIERMMSWRSCLTSVATGDQAIFVTRELFERVGAYPEIALMEDIALSKCLKQRAKIACLKTPVLTSSRKWEREGILRTVWLMWTLRLKYYLGASPDDLAKQYRHS